MIFSESQITLWRGERQVLRLDAPYSEGWGDQMSTPAFLARAATSERAAEALQRGLDRVHRLLTRPFHG
jgi:hypothetical protein